MILMALLIVLLVAVWSDTPLRRGLVRLGAGFKRLLPKTIGGRLALAIAALVVAIVLFQVLKTEAAGIAAPMAPELAAWFALMDVGTAIDLFAVAVLTALTVRLKAVAHVGRTLSAQGVRLFRRGRRSRRRPARRPSRKDSGEGEPWGAAPAFG